eukprot:gene7192-6794_t
MVSRDWTIVIAVVAAMVALYFIGLAAILLWWYIF